MLPKPEKTKKVDQTSLDDSLTRHQLQARKRRLLIISLSLTTGVSAIFFVYRFIRQFTPPTLRFPDLSLISGISFPDFHPDSSDQKITSSLNRLFTTLIPKDFRPQYSIYLTSTFPPSFSWAKNFNPSLETELITKLSATVTAASNPSSLPLVLPAGIEVRQSLYSVSETSYQIFQITTPDRQLFLFIARPAQFPEASSIDLSQLVESIYWAVLENSPISPT